MASRIDPVLLDRFATKYKIGSSVEMFHGRVWCQGAVIEHHWNHGTVYLKLKCLTAGIVYCSWGNRNNIRLVDDDTVHPGLSIACCKCGDYLVEPGGLLFSPPDKQGNTKKSHLCVKCYKKI
jgi:hypothetical protein